LFIKCFLAQ